jgi:hypothetical protein
MRAVLGLTHLMTLVYARALERSGLAVADLAEVAGVTFDRQIGATRELAWEKPRAVLRDPAPPAGRARGRRTGSPLRRGLAASGAARRSRWIRGPHAVVSREHRRSGYDVRERHLLRFEGFD